MIDGAVGKKSLRSVRGWPHEPDILQTGGRKNFGV